MISQFLVLLFFLFSVRLGITLCLYNKVELPLLQQVIDGCIFELLETLLFASLLAFSICLKNKFLQTSSFLLAYHLIVVSHCFGNKICFLALSWLIFLGLIIVINFDLYTMNPSMFALLIIPLNKHEWLFQVINVWFMNIYGNGIFGV